MQEPLTNWYNMLSVAMHLVQFEYVTQVWHVVGHALHIPVGTWRNVPDRHSVSQLTVPADLSTLGATHWMQDVEDMHLAHNELQAVQIVPL